MANPPNFRDLNRQKNSKALEFASFKSKVQKGVGSRVGSGQPPEPPVTPSPTSPPVTPSPTSSSIPPSPTPSVSVSISLTPTITPTSSPIAFTYSLLGPGLTSGPGVVFNSVNTLGFYFSNDVEPNEIPINMEIVYNGEVVGIVVFDSIRLSTPFKLVIDHTNPDSPVFFGNFTSGTVSFSGGPLPTPTVTPTISLTPEVTPTPTQTGTPLPTPPLPTPEPTPTTTPPITPTPNITPTVTPSITVSSTIEPTQTPSSTRTPTISLTPSITPSMTDGASPTPTPSTTPTLTPSLPFVTSYSPNELVYANPAQQETYFIVNYGTVTGDPTGNFYITVNPNDTLVTVEAFYLDESGAPYGTQFIPPTQVESTTTFQISTFSLTDSAANVEEYYLLVNPSDLDEPHWIIPALGDFQVIYRVVAESGEVGTYNWSVDTGAFVDINTTPTPTPTRTPTPTITNSETPPPTPSNTNTPTITPSMTDGATPTPTPTISVTISNSPSVTPSMTIGESPTPTPTVSVSPSLTDGATPTPTATVSPTMTPSVTLTPGHGEIYTSPVTAIPVNSNLTQSFYVNLGTQDSNLTIDFDPGEYPAQFVMTIPNDNSVNIDTGLLSSLSSFATPIYPQDYSAYDLLIMLTVTTSITPTWQVSVNTTPIS